MQNITTRVALVFWGLAVIAVDIQVGQVDILPDFVGYILVALGAAGLVGWSEQFHLARLISWVLVPYPVLLWVFSGPFLKVLSLAGVILNGALLWFLLGGVMAFAESKSHREWVSRASTYRWIYVGLLTFGVLVSFIAPALPNLARVLGYVVYVAMLALMAVILYLFHQVKAAAATQEPGNPFTQPAGDNPPAEAAPANPPAQSQSQSGDNTKQAA